MEKKKKRRKDRRKTGLYRWRVVADHAQPEHRRITRQQAATGGHLPQLDLPYAESPPRLVDLLHCALPHSDGSSLGDLAARLDALGGVDRSSDTLSLSFSFGSFLLQQVQRGLVSCYVYSGEPLVGAREFLETAGTQLNHFSLT